MARSSLTSHALSRRLVRRALTLCATPPRWKGSPNSSHCAILRLPFFFAKMQVIGREVAQLSKFIPLMNGDCLSLPLDEPVAAKLLDNPVGVHDRDADGVRN